MCKTYTSKDYRRLASCLLKELLLFLQKYYPPPQNRAGLLSIWPSDRSLATTGDPGARSKVGGCQTRVWHSAVSVSVPPSPDEFLRAHARVPPPASEAKHECRTGPRRAASFLPRSRVRRQTVFVAKLTLTTLQPTPVAVVASGGPRISELGIQNFIWCKKKLQSKVHIYCT